MCERGACDGVPATGAATYAVATAVASNFSWSGLAVSTAVGGAFGGRLPAAGSGASSPMSFSPRVTNAIVASKSMGDSGRLFGSLNPGSRAGIVNAPTAPLRVGWSTLGRSVTGTTTYSVFRVSTGQGHFNLFRGVSLYAK